MNDPHYWEKQRAALEEERLAQQAEMEQQAAAMAAMAAEQKEVWCIILYIIK